MVKSVRNTPNTELEATMKKIESAAGCSKLDDSRREVVVNKG